MFVLALLTKVSKISTSKMTWLKIAITESKSLDLDQSAVLA